MSYGWWWLIADVIWLMMANSRRSSRCEGAHRERLPKKKKRHGQVNKVCYPPRGGVARLGMERKGGSYTARYYTLSIRGDTASARLCCGTTLTWHKLQECSQETGPECIVKIEVNTKKNCRRVSKGSLDCSLCTTLQQRSPTHQRLAYLHPKYRQKPIKNTYM